jgi:uncharacterized membrane protein
VTLASFALILLSQVCAVTGQIFLKKAMHQPPGEQAEKRSVTALFAAGIASMTVGFFVWIALMSKFDLSYLFPFQGIHYIFIIVAAAIFLKEKTSPTLLIGVLLISAGVAMVSAN